MTTTPHDKLLAIIREMTPAIGKHLAKRKKITPHHCVINGHCFGCVDRAEKRGFNAAIESILDDKDIVLAVVEHNCNKVLVVSGSYYAVCIVIEGDTFQCSVRDLDTTVITLVAESNDQLLALVREAYGMKGDGNATT